MSRAPRARPAGRRRGLALPGVVATVGVLLLSLGGGAAQGTAEGVATVLARLDAARGSADAAVAGPRAAGGRAEDPATSDEVLVNDEVAVATLDPTGLPERATLISRVRAGGPAREVLDPASLTNVRYLDRLGRPAVTGDGVRLVVGGDRPSALTQARFDKPLPVALHAEYALDGRTVPATQVPGAAGEVTVTYTLTNTTAQVAELEYADAEGTPQSATRVVLAPFQGTLTAALPADAALVDDGGAMLATDEQGRTIARWNVALYPPISPPIQRIGFTMRAQRAGIPGVQVELTPAELDQDPATDFSDSLLDGAMRGNTELYRGLTELDRAASAVATGASQLSTGLGVLADGTGRAAGTASALAGGVGDLAGGARRVARASDGLADGLGELAGGADEIAQGSTRLAGALDQAVTGAEALADATTDLASAAAPGEDPVAALIAGGEQIETGLAVAVARVGSPADPVLSLTTPLPPDGDDTCPAGGTAPPDDDCTTIYQGVRLLRDGLREVVRVADAIGLRADRARAAFDQLLADLSSIRDDVTAAASGAADLYASACQGPAPELGPDGCARLADVVDAASAAVRTGAGTRPALEDLAAAVAELEQQVAAVAAALDYALASTERLLSGVEQLGIALGQGTAGQPGLSAGMAQLTDGLRQLSAALAASRAQLAEALGEVAAGSATLADGLGTTAAGASDLAEGTSRLATGTQRAAQGAGSLADGTQALASGADDAAAGAGRFARGIEGLSGGADSAAGAGAELAGGARSLQAEGTAPAADAVLDSSTDPALAQAWLAAASARAANALPYGPPEGGVGHVAYLLTLDEVPAPRSLWQRMLDMVR